MSLPTPIIAVVGRPNVGKSTLFNRILGAHRAVVEDVAGVTRDRNYAYVERYAFPFFVVDTGGFEKDPTDELAQLVVEQAMLAAEEADLILAVFDVKTGLTPGDQDVVKMLRQYKKPIFYVVNKCDGAELELASADFYQLGVDELRCVSALHGRGTKDLVDKMLKALPDYAVQMEAVAEVKRREEQAAQELKEKLVEKDETEELEELEEIEQEELNAEEEDEEREPSFAPVFVPGESELTEEEYDQAYRVLPLEESKPREIRGPESEEFEIGSADEPVEQKPEIECIKVALIGRPNVGKSTLLNTLAGEQRAITSPIAGTTRDILDQRICRDGQNYLLVDTAGLRKKARVSDKIEKYSTLRAMRAINDCDVAVLLIDGVSGPTEQDGKILGLAHEEGKGVVILVNKWDLVDKDHQSVQKYHQLIKDEFKFTPYAPVLFASALTGKRCPKIFDAVKAVALERSKRISTYHLNRVLRGAAQRVNAPSYRGRPVKLYYASQIDSAPPRFVLFFNYPKEVHFSYLRYLKNAIREEFGFSGTDIKLVLRKR